MRHIARTLLVALAMVGLVLPTVMGRAHDVPCDANGPCRELVTSDCADLGSCHDCPPPGDCPGEHGEDNHPDSSDHRDGAPAPCRDHHHHHQCVCAGASTWLISDCDSLSLHAPGRGCAPALREHLFLPESPVFLIERPPAA